VTDGKRKIVQQLNKSAAPHCPLLINIAHLPGDQSKRYAYPVHPHVRLRSRCHAQSGWFGL